jgi:hypothetical protein
MRIDLSRPIPGLLMALPLIAILLSVSRVPISATQPLSRAKEAAIEMTGTAIASAPDVGGQTDRAMAARLDDGGGDRWNSLCLGRRAEWHNRPEAAIGCEVLVSCQPRSIVRRFAVYD